MSITNYRQKSTKNAALAYLKHGFSVIPIGVDKKPLILWKEFQERRATEEEVLGWFEKNPKANVGIVTGAISGIVVIDVEKGGSTEGLTPTVIVKTGGGGFHYYYRHPGFEIKNDSRLIRELTDFRGDGGYVIGPPSLHKSGQRYEWVVAPDEADMVDLPEWILNAKQSPTEVKPKAEWKIKFIAPVTERQRTRWLLK